MFVRVKRMTGQKGLWIRNNLSTMVAQFADARNTTLEAAAIRSEEMLDAGRPGEIPGRIRALKSAPFTSDARPVKP